MDDEGLTFFRKKLYNLNKNLQKTTVKTTVFLWTN